jgi:cytochrome P450
MEGQIREVVERVAAPLMGRHGEVLDLLGEFCNIVPNSVISRLTGIPPGDDELRFRQLSQSVIAGAIPFTSPELKEQADAGFAELSSWVREMVRKRRDHPEEDLVTDLVHAQDVDDRLTEDDVVLLLTGIVGAGSETTALGAASIVRVLLEEPKALERLRADRSLIPGAINEIVRYTVGGPAGTMRFALRDFEMRGQKIRKGQMLMLSMGGANRDPAIFDDPDTLDLERDVREMITFGNGPHFCLGANLARQEMGCMLEALLDVIPPGSKLREDQLEYRDQGIFKRPLNMPVEIGPA